MVVISLVSAFCPWAGAAETWHLEGQQGWQNVANDPSGGYLLAVARIKQNISTGQTEPALAELAQLKNDFPDIPGSDLDAFMAAELIFAEGKWIVAEREYGTFLDTWPDSWLYESALERKFAIATAFLNGQKRRVLKILKLSAYEEGARIMQDIADRAGDAPIAKRSLIALAESYQRREEYWEAYETWADISSRWPTGQEGRDSLLQMAQSLHSAYRSPSYDSTSLNSARSYYENFNSRYPEFAIQYDIAARTSMIDEQLAYKQLSIADYYNRTDNRQAANLYYRLVIDKWPDSTAAKLARSRAGDDPETTQAPEKKDVGRLWFDRVNVVLDKWLKFLEF